MSVLRQLSAHEVHAGSPGRLVAGGPRWLLSSARSTDEAPLEAGPALPGSKRLGSDWGAEPPPPPDPELRVRGQWLRVGVWHGAGSGHGHEPKPAAPQQRVSPVAVRGPQLQE